MATAVAQQDHKGLSVRSPYGPKLSGSTWQHFIASRAKEGGTADSLEQVKLQSAIEAVVAENERLYSLNEQLRLRLGEEVENPKHPMPSDYMPDKNFVKEDKAMFSDVRVAGGPVADFYYRPRAKARHHEAVGYGEATAVNVQSTVNKKGEWFTLNPPDAVRWENDHALVEAIDKSILNPGASAAAYQRIDTSTTDPNELKVPVKVIHVHQGGGASSSNGGGGGGVQEVLREVLVPVVKQVPVEVPSLTSEQKAKILQQEVDEGCKECDDPSCGCHSVPIREVIKPVEVFRTETKGTREVPIYTDRVKVVEVQVPVIQEKIVEVPGPERIVYQERIIEVPKIVKEIVVQTVEIVKEVEVKVEVSAAGASKHAHGRTHTPRPLITPSSYPVLCERCRGLNASCIKR